MGLDTLGPGEALPCLLEHSLRELSQWSAGAQGVTSVPLSQCPGSIWAALLCN